MQASGVPKLEAGRTGLGGSNSDQPSMFAGSVNRAYLQEGS
jgi:hypothetical protein